ncbi:MAG: hypothetical protein J6Q60_05460 [Bacteroidaceae bacterium]|nr:hypothetical protein [Bacteroidaceae bacterium]
MNNQEALDKVIGNLIAELEDTDVGSEEHKALVDAIAKLEDRSLEIQRIQNDAEDKAKTRERELKNDILEQNLKLEQMSDDRIDRWVKNILTGLGIVSSAALAIWGTKKSFEFEKDGTITTIMGRGWVNRLFGKK